MQLRSASAGSRLHPEAANRCSAPITPARLRQHGATAFSSGEVAQLADVSPSCEAACLPRCATAIPQRYEVEQQCAAQQRRRLLADEYRSLDFHGLGGDIDGFRAFLTHKYGNSARGWRLVVAPDKAGIASVTFQEFCSGLRKAGFAGRVRTLWRELSGGGMAPAVMLADLEPDLAKHLDVCAGSLTKHFEGGAMEAWTVMPHQHRGRLCLDEFVRFFQDTEERELLPESLDPDFRQIFDAMDLEGRGWITREDFRFLDHWAHQRLGGGLPQEWRPAKEEPERWSPQPSKQVSGPSLDDFRQYCRKHFGSCGRAWRAGLDVKGLGMLSPSQFGQACRSIGWKHPHLELWHELSKQNDGVVSLRALDSEAAIAIDDFNKAVRFKHGGLDGLQHDVLDPGGTGAISRTEFIAEVQRDLNLEASVAGHVFDVLDTAQTGWIALSEVTFLDAFESTLRPQGFSLSMEGSAELGAAVFVEGASRPALICKQRKDCIWSPANSNRATQYRLFAQTHTLKHHWLRTAALSRCQHTSKESFSVRQQEQRREVRPSPDTDIFRTTNSFYREALTVPRDFNLSVSCSRPLILAPSRVGTPASEGVRRIKSAAALDTKGVM